MPSGGGFWLGMRMPGGCGVLDGLAEMAAESWMRLCAYAEPVIQRPGRGRGFAARLRDGGGSRDTAAFARWAARFEERSEAERLISMAELDGVLREAVRGGRVQPVPSEVLLVGFDQMTPAQERLLAEMRGAGVGVVQDARGDVSERRSLAAARDEAEELRACARWAAAWVERDPEAKIAVIVPDAGKERAAVERVLREVLAPELERIGANEAEVPYEFSLGRALAEMPMVAVALELLRWGAETLPLERVSALLVSAYFAGATSGGKGGEQAARAEFDAFELRQKGVLRPEIGLAGMVKMIGGSRRSGHLPQLLRAVRRMERRARGFEGVAQSFGLWAQAFRELLADAGWGSAGGETSVEYQIRERWEGALDAMSTLDFEDHAAELDDALRAIERIARRTIFAPESRSAPVQVMGPLEAAGSEFDGVWFLRAGEMSWPVAVGSLPLLSWGLQRDLGMPGTDASRDLQVAKRITERLVASGREAVVSFARRSGEVQQRASALVRGLGLEEVATEGLAGVEPERSLIETERVEDVVAFRPLPDEPVRGGVRVLELQAACGFRAFAEQRLSSSEPGDRGLGLSAKENGIVVHKALESFWAEVRTQARLIAMRANERAEALERAIERGLQSADGESQGVWDRAYIATQRERLRRLLSRWLEMEIERPAFEVMQQEQEQRDVQVGPLRFRLRMDRVDLVNESQVLIDYKTGAATPRDWMGDRPDAPQLPMYAILSAGGGRVAETPRGDGKQGNLFPGFEREQELQPVELGAVAFATVKAGKGAKLAGFSAREGLLPGRRSKMEASTFEGQVDRWREVLERLAREFAEGDARVRPKTYPGTCERCGQRLLCRLDASLLEEMEPKEEDGEDG